MRWLVASLATALVAAVCVAVAPSAPQAPGKRVACGAKALTLLFWPEGHDAVPSVNFPVFPTPHLEIYKPGALYPDANALGYLSADGQFSLVPSCKGVAASKVGARIKPSRLARTTTALQCRLAKPALLDVVATAGGSRLTVIVPPSTVAAVATIKPAGSTLAYNTKLCKTAPVPS